MNKTRHVRETDEVLDEIELIREGLSSKTTSFAKEVWCEILKRPEKEYDRGAAVRIGVIMTAYCGWVPTRIRINLGGQRHWLLRAPSGHVFEESFSDVLG